MDMGLSLDRLISSIGIRLSVNWYIDIPNILHLYLKDDAVRHSNSSETEYSNTYEPLKK